MVSFHFLVSRAIRGTSLRGLRNCLAFRCGTKENEEEDTVNIPGGLKGCVCMCVHGKDVERREREKGEKSWGRNMLL